MKHKFSLFFLLTLFCSHVWAVENLADGTYTGTWDLKVMSSVGNKVSNKTVKVTTSNDGKKQTIVFDKYKAPFSGATETTLFFTLTKSSNSITWTKDEQQIGYNNYYFRPYTNYTSCYYPESGIIALGLRYYTLDGTTEKNTKTGYEYIEIASDKWGSWQAFPSAGLDTAIWTFNNSNAYWQGGGIPEAKVTLKIRDSKTDANIKQIKMERFTMGLTNSVKADIILTWNTATNEITMFAQQNGHYGGSYTKDDTSTGYNRVQMRVKSGGSFDPATGVFTLPTDYTKDGYWRTCSTPETLTLRDITPLESISISNQYILQPNNRVIYTATLSPSNATFKNYLQWTSNDGNVADVRVCSTNPLKDTIVGVAEGKAIVTACLGGVTATTKIWVGTFGAEEPFMMDNHPAYGEWKLNTIFTASKTFSNQQIQVCSFSGDNQLKKIKIPNFGMGTLSTNGVLLEMLWDQEENKITIAKQETGRTKTTEEYTSPVYIADNSYINKGVNTSHFDEQNNLFEITPVYFYYKTATAGATPYARAIDTLQLYPVKVTRYNATKHTKYIVPIEGGDAYFEGTEASKAYQMMFKLEGTDFDSASWVVTTPDWVNVTSEGVKQYSSYIGIKFQVADYTLTPRIDTIKVEVYGYTFKMPISQAAPTLTPDPGMDHEQTFTFLPIGDDTLQINGNKKAKIYLNSEVKLNNNITVVSKHGLTKIDKGFGSNPNYFIRLTLTRKQCIQEDAKDTVVVYFTDKPEIRYEYYITQAGTGKLTTSHDYRTLVFGPKANRRGRFVNESGNLSGTNYITIRADIPISGNIKYRSDLAEGNRFYDLDMSIKNSGTDEEYLQIFPKTLSNTNTQLEDNVYFFIPNVDTITLHLVQEPTARVWQRFASSYTAMEVGNKGGKAHFSGYTETELTYISNTPIETDEVAITCADWIEASPIINTNKDTVRITFTIGEYLGMEPRTDTMTITIQGSEFRMPLIQKVFGIEWSLTGGGSELAIPVEGGKTTYLNIFGTEPYREGLLQITTPEGVSITDKSVTTLSTGRQRTSCKFKKEGSVTEDWQDTIFLALDTINQEAGFEYHYKDTIIIIQLAPEPAPTYIREGSVGNYGTLCFPYTPTQDVTGADFYKVLWFNEPAMDLVLEKITSQPEAGVPYIFQYTADQMVWTYNNAETPVDISATGVNGLHGVASEEGYTVSESDVTAGTYLLSNNKIVKAAATSHAAQYRAYLRLSEVSTEAPVGPVTAPRIHMTVPGNGAPTNLNGLNSNTKAYKVLKDGQLLIIRDTKTYNAQGQIIR